MKRWLSLIGTGLGFVCFGVTLIFCSIIKDRVLCSAIGYAMGAAMATTVAIIAIKSEE